MALRNTDEDETMPMYTPKLRELVPEPIEHLHPPPELDPKAIAPDGVADSRTKTQPLPLSWLKALVGLSVLLTVGCGPSTTLKPTVEWDQLESCYLMCDRTAEVCGERSDCWDGCSGAVERVTDECRSLTVSWYTCMAREETTMDCSAWPIPISQDCDDYLRLYHDCQFGGG
jgi:hypothetical protein